MAKLTDIYKMETAQPVAAIPKKNAAVPAIVGKYNLATAQPVQPSAPMAPAPVQPQQMPKLQFQPVAPTSTGEVPFKAQPPASSMGYAEGGAKSFAKGAVDTLGGLTQAGGSAVADVKFGLDSAAAQRYLDVVLPMVKDGRIPENEMEGTMADIKRNQAIVDAANRANYERTKTARAAGDVYRGLVSKDTRAELEQWQRESGLPAKVIAGVAEAIPLMAGGAVASAAGSMVAGPAGGLLAGWQAMAGTESANFRNETTDALVGAGIDPGIANQYVRKYANLYGQMSGIVEHLGNAFQLSAAKIGPKAAMDALKKTGAFKVLTEKFFGGLSEGAEEAIQTGLSNYLKKRMVEDIMRERGEDVAKSIGKESVLAAGGMGALVGLVLQSLGLPGAVAGAAQNAKADATALQSAKAEADRLNAPVAQALSELEKPPTEAILSDLEASGEAERVTAQDLVNMGIPEAEAKAYIQNRIAQGKPTNISGIGQENLVPQEEAKPPVVSQPEIPAPAPEPPQAGTKAPPAPEAVKEPLAARPESVTPPIEKGGVSIFTNDETGEQVSGTVIKETKKSVVVQDENGKKRTLKKDQWAGEAAEPVIKDSLTTEPTVAKSATVEKRMDYRVDDTLVMRSPATNDDTEVNYRGKTSEGTAVVWTGKIQIEVPMEWLRNKGEAYSGGIAPQDKTTPAQQPVVEVSEKPVPETKTAIIEAIIGEKPRDYTSAIEWEKTRKRFAKLSKEELVKKLEDIREQRQRGKEIADEASKIYKDVKKIAEDAGNKWRSTLKKYAEDNGVRYPTVQDISRDEASYQVSQRIAEKKTAQPSNAYTDFTKTTAPVVAKSATVAEPKEGDEGGVLSNLAKRRPNDKPGGIRWDIQNGKIDGLKAKELYRLSGSTEAIIEINGQRFTIDDATRLKFAGIKTDWSGRRSTPSSVKTERDWNDYLAKYPKLGKEDFAKYVKEGDRYVFKGEKEATAPVLTATAKGAKVEAGRPAPRSGVPAKVDRPVVEKKPKLKTGQQWRELAGEEANSTEQVTKARTLLDVIGTKPVLEPTGLQATEYDRDAAAGEPTRKWYSAGSYYPEGWNKQKMAKLKNALRDLDAGKPMRLDQVQLIDEAARTVDSDPKLRQYGGPETAEDFVEAEKFSNRGDKLPVSESDIETGDLVFKDGEWYRAENTPDGTTLVDGKEVDLNHSQEVGVSALFKTTDGETYKVALQQYREQEAKKEKPSATKAVSPSGQAEFIGQDEGGFKLTGEVVKQKQSKPKDQTQEMFTASETRGRALDDLDAKGPTELKRVAEREGVDLELVRQDANSIRNAIRAQRNAKPAPQDIEAEGRKAKPLKGVTGKGGFVGLAKQTPAVRTSANPTVSKVQSILEQQDKDLSDKLAKRGKRVLDSIAEGLWDDQALAKHRLVTDGVRDAEIKLTLRRGWTGEATRQYDDARAKIDRIITHGNEQAFSHYLEMRRLIEVAELKTRKGEDYELPSGMTLSEAKTWMSEFEEQKTADGTLASWESAADVFHDVAKDQLGQMRAEGLIGDKAYQKLLSEHQNYEPQRMIEYLDPENVSGMAGGGGTGIMALKEGSESGRVSDYRFLLARMVAVSQNRIFNNRANKALVDAYTATGGGGAVGAVIPTSRTQPAPHGYKKLSAYYDGVEKHIFVPTAFAESWRGYDPILKQSTAEFLRWAFGAKIVKALATGYNPEFVISNLPRDAAYVWLRTDEYSSVLPLGFAQMAKDYAETFTDALMGKGRWTDYVKQGGALDGLAAEGQLVKNPWEKVTPTTKVSKSIHEWLGYLGQASERWTRLALYNRALKNGKSKTEAVYIARSELDFSQGGRLTKAIDTVVPYLNAATQATRGIAQGFSENGWAKQSFKIGQVMAIAAGLGAIGRELFKDLWDSISDTEKATKWIIPLPEMFAYEDKKGRKRHRYIAIPKDQGQAMFASIADSMLALSRGEDVNMKQVGTAIANAFPDISADAPLYSAYKAYVDNYDTFKNDKIYKGRPSLSYAEYSESEVMNKMAEGLYKATDGVLDVSPLRAQTAGGKLLLPYNPLIYLTGLAIEQSIPSPERKKFADATIDKYPFVRRLIRSTQPLDVPASVSDKAEQMGIDISGKTGRSAREQVFKAEKELGAERNKTDRQLRSLMKDIKSGDRFIEDLMEYYNGVKDDAEKTRIKGRLKAISTELGMQKYYDNAIKSRLEKPRRTSSGLF